MTSYSTKKSKVPARKNDVTFESVKLMLEPAQYSLNSVAKPDKALVGDIFEQCNRDIKELYAKTNPRMTYPKITSHSRSKHCTGFLCKYSDTLVFRVFSRNDVYKNRVRTGITVMESTTTEILRVIWVEGKVYSFSKNFCYYNGYYYNNTTFPLNYRLPSPLPLSSAYLLPHVGNMGKCHYTCAPLLPFGLSPQLALRICH